MLGPMELLFIRHGEPAWSNDGMAVDDPPLTERGHHQAELVAKLLADEHVDDLYVSPLARAQQTAGPIAAATGVEATTLPWLKEIWPGGWEGTPQEVVERTFRESRDRPLDEQWVGIPGGESFRDFHARVVAGFTGLFADAGAQRLSDHPPLWKLEDTNRRVVVVAHGGTNAVSLGFLLGIEPVPWEWERFISFHASVSRIRPIEISGGHSFSLFQLSDTSHLPEEDRTH
jgi:broad specificity phosphatase PhoE